VELVDGASLRIADMVSSACDVSTKRLKFYNNKRGVYWWNEEVARVRRRGIAVRRLLTRRRKRGSCCENLEDLYRKARRDLCKNIKKAKSEAWGTLIQILDEDPWGLPYKIVIGRLRRSGPTLSEMLEPVVAERLLDNLFPSGEVHNPDQIWGNRGVDNQDCSVSVEEVIVAIRGRRRGGCPAPGPNGLSLDIWKKVPRCVLETLASLYSRYLAVSRVPKPWKRAILVLIPKGGINIHHPKARPICLLDDVGKFFKRILNARLKAHLDTRPWRCALSGDPCQRYTIWV